MKYGLKYTMSSVILVFMFIAVSTPPAVAHRAFRSCARGRHPGTLMSDAAYPYASLRSLTGPPNGVNWSHFHVEAIARAPFMTRASKTNAEYVRPGLRVEGKVDPVRLEVFYDAQHPYTWGLLGSIARLDRPKPRRLAAIPGQPPSLLRLSPGCAFGDRCAHRFDLCDEQPPLLDRVGGNHLDACHLEPKQKKELRETTIHPELIGNAE